MAVQEKRRVPPHRREWWTEEEILANLLAVGCFGVGTELVAVVLGRADLGATAMAADVGGNGLLVTLTTAGVFLVGAMRTVAIRRGRR